MTAPRTSRAARVRRALMLSAAAAVSTLAASCGSAAGGPDPLGGDGYNTAATSGYDTAPAEEHSHAPGTAAHSHGAGGVVPVARSRQDSAAQDPAAAKDGPTPGRTKDAGAGVPRIAGGGAPQVAGTDVQRNAGADLPQVAGAGGAADGGGAPQDGVKKDGVKKDKGQKDAEKKAGDKAAPPKLDILGTDCENSRLDRHDGFQKAPRCVETSFGEVSAAAKNPSLLITDAPRRIRPGQEFPITVSTRNLVRDRFLGAAAGGYYAESSFLDGDGIQRGHFHTACRMLERLDAAPDAAPDPAFFFATQDNKGGAGEDKAIVNVSGLTERGTAQCAVWAGDGSHRVPMMERANQTPAFDVVRITVG